MLLGERGVTRREAEVLAALSERLTNAEIAARLHVSERTVESHVSSLLRKLQVANRRELSLLAADTLTADGFSPAALPTAFESYDASASSEFVARDDELARLTSAWETAVDERPQTVLIEGEAGVGKTRLLARFASTLRAVSPGLIVVAAECAQLGMSALEPWLEALGRLLSTLSSDAMSWALADSTFLAPLLGVAESPRSASDFVSEPTRDRLQIFDAMSRLLARLSSRHPVLLIIDDLQWADEASLVLMQQIVRRRRHGRVLIAATIREGEPIRETYHAVFDDLRGDPDVDWLRLGRLGSDSTTSLVTSLSGGALGGEAALRVYELTDGNPFFTSQLVAQLTEHSFSDDEMETPEEWLLNVGVPAGVRDIIGRRLVRLDEATRSMLECAAVTGASFELDVVSQAAEIAPDDMLERLDVAERRGVVVASRLDPTVFEFSHALMRATLLDGLSGAARCRLHERVAVAVEQCHAHDLEPFVGTLAYHWWHAPRHRGREHAVRFALLAAAAANQRYAWEDAKQQCRHALELLTPTDDLESLWQAHYQLAQAHSELFEYADLMAAVTAACETAHRLNDPIRLVRAVLLLRGRESLVVLGDEAHALLEGALDRLPDGDSTERVLGSAALLAHVIEAARGEIDLAEFERRVDDVLAMAHRLGDLATERQALIYLVGARTGLPGAVDRLSGARRVHRLDQDLGGDGSIALTAAAEAHARLGNRDGLEAALAAIDTAYDGASTHVAAWSPFVRSVVQFIDGKLDVTWDITREVFEGTPRGSSISFACVDRMNRIRWLQGSGPRSSDTGLPRDVERTFPQLATLRALSLAEKGHDDDARAVVDELLDDSARRLHWNGGRPRTLHDLAETVGLVNDARLARALLPMLEPYDDEVLCSYLISVDGAAATCLGILETIEGDFDAADRHFAAGLALEEQLGARLCAATTRVWWAHMLRQRHEAGDAEKAALLVEDATDVSEHLHTVRIINLHRRLLGA